MAIMRWSALMSGAAALLAAAWLAAAAGAQQDLYVLPGIEPGELLGASMHGGSDVDGDGYPDLIVGAPGWTALQSKPGAAYVYSGKSGALLYTFQGEMPEDNFGFSVTAADVNADGYADPIIGAPYSDQVSIIAGSVYVYSGKTGELLQLLLPDYQSGAGGFGSALSGGGDADGDGFEDFVVGHHGYYDGTHVGAAKLISGRTFQALQQVFGTKPYGTGFGFSVTMTGDLDGDQLVDFAVGAMFEDFNGLSSGAVQAFSSASGAVLYAVNGKKSTMFGYSLASLGDVDGDGVTDVVVGAMQGGPAIHGSVSVLSGQTGALLLEVFGENSLERLGGSVAGMGDFDGDGTPDFLSGPAAAVTFNFARVFSGATGTKLLELIGPADSGFGKAVTGMGDLNGDGLGDLAVGAAEANLNGALSGVAYAYLAGTPVTPYCTAKLNSQGCLPVLESTGAASLSVGDNFMLSATQVINSQVGILLWSRASGSAPLFGGMLCLGSPLVRCSAVLAGGNAPPTTDCSGKLSYHFSQGYMQAQGLTAGTSVYAQYWYRDPAHPDGTGVGLSAALAFTVIP